MGKILKFTNHCKYLGVVITKDLKWKMHIDYVTNKAKATKILALLKHVLYNAPTKVKLIAYKILRRPLLEYACEEL